MACWAPARGAVWFVLGSTLALTPALVHAGGQTEDVLLEFHYQPVPDVQVAIWLTDAEGNFVQDVFVTQATGTLGIGNRPGRWDFLSSWRFPYGPRPQVLPVWAHARGKTYPALVFHDDDPGDLESLGWHENSSSAEPYYCRPLTADEQTALLEADVMSCPSPAVFQSDKGRFSGEDVSAYPPRNDVVQFEDGGDHPDVMMFGGLNDLDAVTGATPVGDEPEMTTTIVPRAVAEAGPLVAWIEIGLEHDENVDWEFDREADHFVDPRLESYGIEYLGQPSVVYKVEFDPMDKSFAGVDAYAGYGEFDGSSGILNPPDASISTTGGSGADRLQLFTKNDETFRFGVYSHGPGSGTVDPTGGDEGGSDEGSSGEDAGDSGGDDGWGCDIQDLPPVDDFVLEPVSFDKVRVHFTVPPLGGDADVRRVTIYSRPGTMPLTEDNASASHQSVPTEADCAELPAPGVSTWCEVDELFGNFDYQIGLRYEDICSNKSALVAAATTTPAQKFATVEGACFVATAAWGAPWTDRVRALRLFRDHYLKGTTVGAAVVQFYYANSPMLARAIAQRPWARALAREMLAPVTDVALVATPR